MTSIKNLISLIAAIPTATVAPSATIASTTATPLRIGECGQIDVFYTGLPPYHPLVAAQHWDPLRVDYGLKNGTAHMVKAGYNVQVVWAGTEVPIDVLESRMDETGADFDLVAIGFGIRGSTMKGIVERLEDLIDMYKRKTPNTPIVFNHSPESLIWSVEHRIPMREDCEAIGKPGKLLGYEEICDSRCNHKQSEVQDSKTRDEL